MPRELTQQEKSWLARGLNSLASGTYDPASRFETADGRILGLLPSRNPSFYLSQISGLRVVDEYQSESDGIYWVKFQHCPQEGSVGLVTYFTEEGRFLLIMVDEKTRFISELEIF